MCWTAIVDAVFQVERPDQLKEIVPQKRLADKVSGILSRIEAELDAVDEKIGERMHILDLDNDGLVSQIIHFRIFAEWFQLQPCTSWEQRITVLVSAIL